MRTGDAEATLESKCLWERAGLSSMTNAGSSFNLATWAQQLYFGEQSLGTTMCGSPAWYCDL